MEGTMDQIQGLYGEPTPWTLDTFYNVTPTNGTSGFQFSPSPVMDMVINIIILVTLFCILVSLGCTMEIAKIKGHICKPKGVIIALASQYGIMPLTAFSLAKLLQLSPIESVTMLICGCSPGGNLSNIIALAAQGDMNLSLVMTSCSTLLALGMMPLLLFLYCQSIPNIESMVPYAGIVLALVLTLVPCAIGIAINHRAPRYSPIVIKVGMSVFMIGSVTFVTLSVMMIGRAILAVMTPTLLASAALMPLIGFLFGYLVSMVFRINEQGRRTISIETGCQNIQLCVTILKVAFAPEVIGPLFLFPHVLILCQVMEAVVFVLIFRCHQRFTRAPSEEKLEYLAVDRKAEEAKAP
ncbi:hypothetical protein AAFF_G00247880 [Aldrovandia affinis]|uniref:Hepatic sodium/bile acid cotransporter n=1 Tax=Aldrovandia affinis TaxID=143900 RepID=A0AAD7RDZ4_9TELE|nr:hypothetical protein AAFF_G00247880 [Aldrovandia affinis]